MLIHVAWLKFRENIDQARIDYHMKMCRQLVGRIPVVADLKCGKNMGNRSNGFTHCILVYLPGLEAVESYLTHPAHAPVAKALKDDLADLLVMDVEV